MLTVDDYAKYRTAHRDGMTIRQIARTFHSLAPHGPRGRWPPPSPSPTPAPSRRPAPVLGPFHRDHRPDPRRRRATPRPSSGTPPPRSSAASATSTATPAATPRSAATSLKHRRRHRETFIPLAHLPGQRLEADFGHIHVDFPDGRRLVPFLVDRLGLLQRPLRPGPAHRAHRGHPRRHGRAPSSSSAACPARSGGTTPGPSPR